MDRPGQGPDVRSLRRMSADSSVDEKEYVCMYEYGSQ